MKTTPKRNLIKRPERAQQKILVGEYNKLVIKQDKILELT